ncbi:ATP-binding cassette domain-containing protein [Phaeobacter gallaeciensis]|nr:ATP-binding cassette domain-containing protein [Phaeobacter gallaeciensis]
MKIEALSAKIGGQGILHDVSLEMAPAEWLAVVGGSGAGKSTLLRAVMGLNRPARATKGHMLFNGVQRAFASSTNTTLDGITYVPQSPAHGFDPLRRLRWQWDQLARRKKAPDASHQRHILSALGLPDLGSSYPHQWSRGMQQRLLLAMALIDAPKLLILDEPTSALDPLIASQVLQETRRIASKHGIAVMMVTHDLALAARFAGRIAIMQRGRIVECGAADVLLSNPQHPYSRELVEHRCWDKVKPELTHAAE